MSDPKTCSRCGAPLGSGDELCPRCLLELGRAKPDAGESGISSSAPRRKRRAPPPLSEISARFPELDVLALIGEGGMGAVYKARQTKIERTVALKVLALDPSEDPTFAERFRREALVLARLDHVHVVKLYDFGERDGLFYLVLEFVDGTNLRALMKQGLLTPKVALTVVPQMCEALQFAHDEGIVHRDIKPENVLIDSKGRVKIADFGLAKIVDADPRDVSLTEVGQVMGTPHYMAPEQLRGAADVDHRADIYSLGVVFYEMLTGELPRGKFDLPSKHVHVDVRLDEIVLKSLERAPERRYQHAIEVKTDVENVRTGDGVLESLRARTRRLAREARADRRAQGRVVAKGVVLIYPRRSWHFFVLFPGLWSLVGWAFNGGTGWLIGALLFLATAFWSLMEHEVQARPELEKALQSERRDVIAARHITAILLLLGTFGLAYLGHVALFDACASNYRPGPNDPSAMRSGNGLETTLLPALAARLPLAWPFDPTRVEFTRHMFDPLDLENLYHQPWLLLLAIGMCIATVATYGSRWSDLIAWRGWRIPLRATGSLFGSLLLVHGACAVIQFASNEGGPFVGVLPKELRVQSCKSSDPENADVTHRLRIALVERGYASTATGVWSFREGDKSAPEGELTIAFADPASPLDRWRMTWAGPKRKAPHAVFVVRSRRGDDDCSLACDLGDVRQDAREQREWTEWYRSLKP